MIRLPRNDPDPRPPKWSVLAGYISGECTPDERAAVEAWLAADPRRAARLDALRAMWERATAAKDAPADSRRKQRAWDRIVARVGLEQASASPAARTRSFRVASPSRPWLAAAAAAALIVGAVALFRLDIRRPAPPSREFATQAGQRAWITLPDSSRVLLSPATVVTLDAASDSTRGVSLAGEAYFVIRHDPRRPFRVRAAGTVATVMGTTFGIRARAGEDTVELVVSSGRVRFARADQPGAGLLVDSAQAAHAVGMSPLHLQRDADPATRLAWTRGRLMFRRTPLAQVARELGTWFDLDIVLADRSLAARTVSANPSLASSADEILSSIAAIADARVERQGRRVVLRDINPQSGRRP